MKPFKQAMGPGWGGGSQGAVHGLRNRSLCLRASEEWRSGINKMNELKTVFSSPS